MKPPGTLTLEQLRAAERRARARVEANLSPEDLRLALQSLRTWETRIGKLTAENGA